MIDHEYNKEDLRSIHQAAREYLPSGSSAAESTISRGLGGVISGLYVLASLLVDVRDAVRAQTEVIKSQRNQAQQIAVAPNQPQGKNQQQPRSR